VSTQTVKATGISSLPRVNLMPPEIAEAARFRQLQFAMVAAVVASGAIVGALYVHAKSGVTSAQSEVTAAQSQQAGLQTQLSGLTSVQQTLSTVAAKQALLQQAMGPEIRWSYVLNDLSYRIPTDVWLTGISASETTATTVPAASTTPVAPASDIGNITFDGVAFKHDDVAAWLDALATEKGLTQATFTSSTEGAIGSRTVVDFGSTVIVDDRAMSNRYVPKASN
jgi:Tfp pilus assembly protein PilN